MEKNKTGKYLKYASGEIFLVVIGILIALSINNWNEDRKNKHKARAYLAAIRTDLLQDLEEIESMSVWKERLKCFNEVFPNFELTEEIANLKLSDTNCEITYRIMFNQHQSFRSNTATFDAMISEGSAKLISNKILFAKIQRLYTFWNPALLDVYNTARTESSRLKYKWAHLVALNPKTSIAQTEDTALIADLTIFFHKKRSYIRFVSSVEELIGEIISEIDVELNK